MRTSASAWAESHVFNLSLLELGGYGWIVSLDFFWFLASLGNNDGKRNDDSYSSRLGRLDPPACWTIQ